MFTHLHVHSAFSLLEGTFSIPQLLFRLEKLQVPAIALTDTNALYGAVTFYKFAQQLGIKPLIGCCLQSAEGQAVLLAKNRIGFSQISRIVTARRLVENFSLIKDLKKIAYTSDPEFFVISSDESLIHSLSGCWTQGSLFVEVTRNNQPGNEKKIRRLADLAASLRLPLVATNDVHFLYSQDFLLHRVFSAIRNQSHIHAKLPLSAEDSWLKTPQEMKALFSDLPEAIENTALIAQQCDADLQLGRFTFPDFPLPDGQTADGFLEELSRKGLEKRYPGGSIEASNKLQEELRVIRRLGFARYFLVVWDILQYAQRHHISWVGRGSAANSIVSYALGITNVDPVRYDLFFERFLNPERKSPPDIDLDFGWKQRDEILNYVYERYGHDRVAMICTYVTFSARLAVREIGKALGLPDEEITAVSSRIPYSAGAKNILEDLTQFPQLQGLPVDQQPYQTILKLAAHIDGFPRHLSIHAGGIVIAPYPLSDMVPLERATKGLIVTQYDMYGVEDIGLVKIDLLAQRSLSVLDDVLKKLRQRETALEKIYDYNFLYEDQSVKQMIRNGDTMGCFYIESPSMRGLLQKLRVTTFEDLTAASSVIRPGVAESGMMQQYIRRKTREEPVSYLHPTMENILNETCGVMIYQEDVIRVAHEIAGLSLGEADLLRRAMSGKERSPLAMEEIEKQFLDKARANGIESAVAREIWRQIASFAAYAFSKAHSASYAQLSFQVAYLKSHYPADFLAAVLSNQGGYYTTTAYIEEARRMGLRLLLPDVRQGEFEYAAVDPHTIRVGLMQVKDIALKHWETFFDRRQKQPFTDFIDFLTRTDFNEAELQTLIQCGACDSFCENRPRLLWLLKSLFPVIRKQRSNSNLPGFETIRHPKIPELRNYTEDERLFWEMQLLDIAVSKHPLYFYKPWKKAKHTVKAKFLSDYPGESVEVIGWLVTTKPSTTSKNEAMMFVSFEDTDTIFETTFFPRAYRQYIHLLTDRGPFLIRGKVEEDHGVFTITVERLKHL